MQCWHTKTSINSPKYIYSKGQIFQRAFIAHCIKEGKKGRTRQWKENEKLKHLMDF